MPSNQDPSDLFGLGLKFLGEAVKTYGREVRTEAKTEGEQLKDVWSQVTDALGRKPAPKQSTADSSRDELLFGLVSRGVEALESIAVSLRRD